MKMSLLWLVVTNFSIRLGNKRCFSLVKKNADTVVPREETCASGECRVTTCCRRRVGTWLSLVGEKKLMHGPVSLKGEGKKIDEGRV